MSKYSKLNSLWDDFKIFLICLPVFLVVGLILVSTIMYMARRQAECAIKCYPHHTNFKAQCTCVYLPSEKP